MKFNKALAVLVVGTYLTGCNSAETTQTQVEPKQSGTETIIQEDPTEKTFKIICSTFPVYEWTKEILGDNSNVELSILMDNGIDPHNYQASAEDIVKLQTSDLCIYIGGESEKWIDEAMANSPNTKAINLMHELEEYTKLSETIEGMEHVHGHEEDEHSHEEDEHTHEEDEHTHDEDEHSHDEDEHSHEEDEHTHDEDEHTHDEDEHTHDEDEHSHDEDEHIHDEHDHTGHDHSHADEHIWLSLKIAAQACDVIADCLVSLDEENADKYIQNLESYTSELKALDEQYEAITEQDDSNKVLIFGDRFPFRYLVDDYDLDYYAAFTGCSTDAEASFETIVFLTEKLNETGMDNVCYISDNSKELAETIIKNSDDQSRSLVQFNSIETMKPEDGISYIDIMKTNLLALEEVLK
ncbi:hypothetical protein AN639_05735 [Candidatus Epulonipiscium fishelsonii]|uniref:Uncharacterized protein n=1 Tax=Candidatus Epulonipiscium fishelsonii TaxID=77094 RepID=A0ACC8XGR6_9FIRM|nr:hypothetical protein AN639_05735 [Epulopiscium sp. SCG-B05WGA-EpuloA1]ONI42894.1 hypothetical protein AN396_12955 [Epulopiscium sp. SCG-B11WGA-EpuloA1]